MVAALLNPDLRAVLAELGAETTLTDARRARATERLVGLGLVRRDADGTARFDEASVRELLAEDAAPRPTGPERFLKPDGRIDRYPMRADDRRALLEWVVSRAIPADTVLTEHQLGERLAAFTTDVAVLRRYLVDHGLLERTPSGSEYARTD